jgi:TRAP-type C4-dicarboxylate transport system permease small subunit
LLQLPARAVNWLSSASHVVAGAAMVTLIITTTYEVVMRYVFNRPTIWALEIGAYMFMAIVLLAAAHIQQEDRHISMAFFTSRLSSKANRYNKLFASILGVIFCGVVVWKSWEYTSFAYTRGYDSGTELHVPLFLTIILIPLGFSLLGLQFLVQIGSIIRSHRASSSKSDPL